MGSFSLTQTCSATDPYISENVTHLNNKIFVGDNVNQSCLSKDYFIYKWLTFMGDYYLKEESKQSVWILQFYDWINYECLDRHTSAKGGCYALFGTYIHCHLVRVRYVNT